MQRRMPTGQSQGNFNCCSMSPHERRLDASDERWLRPRRAARVFPQLLAVRFSAGLPTKCRC
jgi:hypothetical protein